MGDKESDMLKGDNQINTVVGSSVKLTGALKDTNDIVVHGVVEGEVNSDQNVQVGETAKIKGPVGGQNISVSGEVKGTIVAAKKLEIHPSGKVTGNILTNELIIQGGAIFVGKSEMPIKKDIEEKKKEEPTKKDKVKEAGGVKEDRIEFEIEE